MRWLITGAGGMLGRDVLATLRHSSEDVAGFDIGYSDLGDLDITKPRRVRETIKDLRPDIVLNCAAWTAVDDAERQECTAQIVNGLGPRILAEACARTDYARLIHISTDYVFAGDSWTPYPEYAKPNPRTAYGRTKLDGETAVLNILQNRGLVVRTAWLYGAHGPNFVRTMIRLERQLDTVDVVYDQRGQPTWTSDVAERLVYLGRSPHLSGIFHATSSGEASWYDLARAVFERLGADPNRVRATTSDRFLRPARRPAYSVLGHARWAELGMAPIRHWQTALDAAIPGLTT